MGTIEQKLEMILERVRSRQLSVESLEMVKEFTDRFPFLDVINSTQCDERLREYLMIGWYVKNCVIR